MMSALHEGRFCDQSEGISPALRLAAGYNPLTVNFYADSNEKLGDNSADFRFPFCLQSIL